MFWNISFVTEFSSIESINRKHEMFWNIILLFCLSTTFKINRKHEMFWNFACKLSTK